MKKTLKILLITAILCVVALTLVGCGDEKENTTEEEQEIKNVETSDKLQISRGEWQGDKYINEFAGIKFNLQEGWSKATDEQIAQMMNIGVEALNEEQQKLAELAEQSSVYGMVVSNDNNGANVVLTLEKPILKVTPEYYLESLKQQLEVVESFDYELGKQYTTEIAGEIYYAIDAEISGYSMSQHYYVKAVDDYIIAIIVTTTADGQIDEILSCFE